jgi:hypothetical protein
MGRVGHVRRQALTQGDADSGAGFDIRPRERHRRRAGDTSNGTLNKIGYWLNMQVTVHSSCRANGVSARWRLVVDLLRLIRPRTRSVS